MQRTLSQQLKDFSSIVWGNKRNPKVKSSHNCSERNFYSPYHDNPSPRTAEVPHLEGIRKLSSFLLVPPLLTPLVPLFALSKGSPAVSFQETATKFQQAGLWNPQWVFLFKPVQSLPLRRREGGVGSPLRNYGQPGTHSWAPSINTPFHTYTLLLLPLVFAVTFNHISRLLLLLLLMLTDKKRRAVMLCFGAEMFI